jgi:hypothetical protein
VKYTKEGILAQIFVAFGQGSGTLRVSQEACLVLSSRYGGLIDEHLLAIWSHDDIAPQVLERMRAIGRSAAVTAAFAGRTAIGAEDVRRAVVRVEDQSRTLLCPPPPPPPGSELAEGSELAAEVALRRK